MAQSVQELRHESERSRAQLTATVEQLKERVTDSAEDIRHKVSPQHVKSEVSDYVTHKTQSWVSLLKQHARQNPMQAVGAGALVAVPVIRLARGFSLPLVMMAAGLALTSRSVRNRAGEAAAPAIDNISEMQDAALGRAQDVRDQAMGAVSSAQNQVTGAANDMQEAAADLVGDLRNRAAQTTSTITDSLRSGMDSAKDTIEHARSTVSDAAAAARHTAANAPSKAGQVIGDNAVLIGALGIAIGAIIATALPETDAEAELMGQASDSVKRAAGEAAQTGFEAAKGATISAADAAMKGIADADLGGQASRMTQNIADTLKEAAGEAATAAFNPSQNPNT